jgi:hypothetical protein
MSTYTATIRRSRKGARAFKGTFGRMPNVRFPPIRDISNF